MSSVVQVFRKEKRIQRKVSTGRRKKLTPVHEKKIMDIISEKEGMSIEEIRSKFLVNNPDVPKVYRLFINYLNILTEKREDFY